MSKTPRTDKVKMTALTERSYDKIECVPVELSYRLENELADKDKQLAEAQAEIERLKNEHEDSLRRAKDNAVSLSGAVTEYAGELLVKDKLIEQMLEALVAVVRVADRATVEFDMARAAIKAAKGEIQ